MDKEIGMINFFNFYLEYEPLMAHIVKVQWDALKYIHGLQGQSNKNSLVTHFLHIEKSASIICLT